MVETLNSLKHAPYARRYSVALRHNQGWAKYPKKLDKLLNAPSQGRAWEADHARRVADGGGEALADHVQTLCVPCHALKTAAENRANAKKRKRGPTSPHPKPDPSTKADADRVAALLAESDGDDDGDWM